MVRVALGFALLLASGCATSANPQVGTSQNYVSLADQRAALEAVRVETSVPPGARVLGKVDAERCHRRMGEIEPTPELVSTDLRVAAYARGGDGITDIKIESQMGLLKNCWYVLVGSATVFEDPPK